MLRKESKFILGTIAECAKELYNSDEKRFENRFVNCDFAIADGHVDVGDDLDFEHDDLETIFENSSGWYGIKKLDTGFDNSHDDDVDLFADYYGGGCGTYRLVGDWDDEDEIVNTIKKMIIMVMSYNEGIITENDIIVCEIKEDKTK